MTRSGSRTPCRSHWGRSSSCSGPERGGSAVEFALVLPAIIIILFGIFDFGRAFLTQHGLSAAAREGARLAIAARPVTDGDVEARIDTYLDGANIEDATISIDPSADGAESGDEITVSITKDFTMSVIPMTMTLRGTSVMVKE